MNRGPQRSRQALLIEYAERASGKPFSELPISEREALETIYDWGPGPTQIHLLPGENFAAAVARVKSGAT